MPKARTGSDALEKSPDELDLEIGRLLLADQFGSKPIAEAEAKAAAQRWFTANIARFRDAVCANPTVQNQLLKQSAQSRNELFAAVGDALLRVPGLAIPVMLLSARLIHYGVGQLCQGVAKERSS